MYQRAEFAPLSKLTFKVILFLEVLVVVVLVEGHSQIRFFG